MDVWDVGMWWQGVEYGAKSVIDWDHWSGKMWNSCWAKYCVLSFDLW